MSDRIALGFTGLAVLFLIGVMYVGYTTPLKPNNQEYRVDVKATAAGDVVKAEGKTNLPSGARLTVFVDRLYRTEGSGTWQAGRVGETTTTVRDGKWEAEVPLNEEPWVKNVAQKVNQRSVGPVEAIQSRLRTTVVFSPLTPQAASVQNAVGPDFGLLEASDGAVHAGRFWLMRQWTLINKPLPLNLERVLMPARS